MTSIWGISSPPLCPQPTVLTDHSGQVHGRGEAQDPPTSRLGPTARLLHSRSRAPAGAQNQSNPIFFHFPSPYIKKRATSNAFPSDRRNPENFFESPFLA